MKKRKPQIVWMVKSYSGNLLIWTAATTKRGAGEIYQWTKKFDVPPNYSVVRVELREVRAAK